MNQIYMHDAARALIAGLPFPISHQHIADNIPRFTSTLCHNYGTSRNVASLCPALSSGEPSLRAQAHTRTRTILRDHSVSDIARVRQFPDEPPALSCRDLCAQQLATFGTPTLHAIRHRQRPALSLRGFCLTFSNTGCRNTAEQH
ncbi:hypothetical protein BCR34DRAFT_568506 [Clohesyomyces aquaticus]|uniref:Uncharacterized protein n=1 Tax=Clohesyomyces aquaticus TaxID=1231657 RepID=A0A1Y1ZGH5_9PLEO|nr:hypothetical protein BCR34DRAFT_568506 [Clohesyomyces aquaticus]